MSKSLGNVIDPLHVIHGASFEAMAAELRRGNLAAAEVERAEGQLAKELPQGIPPLGTDALRVALADYMRQGRQINMDLANVQRWRRFGNKMWQATRFALSANRRMALSPPPLSRWLTDAPQFPLLQATWTGAPASRRCRAPPQPLASLPRRWSLCPNGAQIARRATGGSCGAWPARRQRWRRACKASTSRTAPPRSAIFSRATCATRTWKWPNRCCRAAVGPARWRACARCYSPASTPACG